MSLDEELEYGRPHLRPEGHSRESAETPSYNCFAWAADETQACWEPESPLIRPHPKPTYWPAEAPNDLSLESFVQAFATLRYAECDMAELEPGFERLAIYVDSEGYSSPASRQLASVAWTSKIGELEDIEHKAFKALAGGEYGGVAIILKRPRSD